MKTYFVYCIFKKEFSNNSINSIIPDTLTYEIVYSSKEFLIVQTENYPMMTNTLLCNSPLGNYHLSDLVDTLLVIEISNINNQFFTRDNKLKKILLHSGLKEI